MQSFSRMIESHTIKHNNLVLKYLSLNTLRWSDHMKILNTAYVYWHLRVNMKIRGRFVPEVWFVPSRRSGRRWVQKRFFRSRTPRRGWMARSDFGFCTGNGLLATSCCVPLPKPSLPLEVRIHTLFPSTINPNVFTWYRHGWSDL